MRQKIYCNKVVFSIIILLSVVLSGRSFGQLTVTTVSTSSALASKLAGPGITIVRDSLICDRRASGTFTSVSTPITLDSGILLTTGLATSASGAESGVTSTNLSASGDNDLRPYLGTTSVTADACQLIIYLVPGGDTVTFNYQFGSEEYINSTCGRYNDAFAFFIAGPGVSTTYPGVNMALVPGTTIPVTVNSINSGIPCTGSGCALSNCTSMGTGSPFTAYYINNAGGTSVAYRGYTRPLTAKHWVRPCDTYRLKMTICDAGNSLYDSGVFIEAGSLKSNSFFFDRTRIGRTINGVSNTIVRGCPGDTVYVKTNRAVSTPTTVRFSYGGAAIGGVDFNQTDSVLFRTGDSVVKYAINGLTSGTGSTSTIIRITSYTVCNTFYSSASDSVLVSIIDKPTFAITTSDTTVCQGKTVKINTVSSPATQTITWTPAAGLDNALIASPTATVTAPVTYVVTANLVGSLCPAIYDTINIGMATVTGNIITPDTTICQGKDLTIRVNGIDTLYYNWTPATGLSSNNAKQPAFVGSSSTNYTLTITDPTYNCTAADNISITVVPDFTVTTRDSVLCEGNNITLVATVQPTASTYTYAWTGPSGYSSALLNPTITTLTQLNEGWYNLTVTNMGVCSKSAREFIQVEPTLPASILAPEIVYCQYAPSQPVEIPGYSNVMWYNDPNDSIPTLFAPRPNTDTIGKQIFYAAQISLKNNCLSQMQPIEVNIKSCCNGNIIVPSAFTPNDDGKNDVLKVIKGNEYVINQFSIFDRWGTKVFDASSDKQWWDGKINGVPADLGTYYYVLIANCTNAEKTQLTLKGDVVLIR